MSALEDAKKKTKVTADKIELVKDILPAILRPGGMNPLSIIHETRSQALHRLSDERCIELAETTREALEYLMGEVSVSTKASNKFTKGMQKLIESRKK